MAKEGISTIEDWFRWAEEWAMTLKFFGAMKKSSRVLEVGCGLGRIAYPLRYQLLSGTYDGFDICAFKIDFLRMRFQSRYPNFQFVHADVHNTEYNPEGRLRASDFRFPYADGAFDIVYAASVFTHLVPESARNYLQEISRVLQSQGRAVISVLLLDYFDRQRTRPFMFAHQFYDFHHYPDPKYPDSFAVSDPGNLEAVTAYRADVLLKFATDAGLQLVQPPIPGMWSGGTDSFVLPQDLMVFRHR
jgi:SAM-dependent methyltransferase